MYRSQETSPSFPSLVELGGLFDAVEAYPSKICRGQGNASPEVGQGRVVVSQRLRLQ